MFSAVISAFFSISLTISSPFGDFRLIAIDFLLTLNWRKYQGSSSGLPGRKRRPGSPRPGFSILTTSAPNQARTSVQVVPASNWVKSTTWTPCRKLNSWTLSLMTVSSRECVATACPFPRVAATLRVNGPRGAICATLGPSTRGGSGHESRHAQRYTECAGGKRRAHRRIDGAGTADPPDHHRARPVGELQLQHREFQPGLHHRLARAHLRSDPGGDLGLRHGRQRARAEGDQRRRRRAHQGRRTPLAWRQGQYDNGPYHDHRRRRPGQMGMIC